MTGAILALDSGTSSSKAAVFDLSGRALGLARAPVRTRFAGAGRVQQDPLQILSSQRRAMAAALRQAGRPVIEAVGVASQRSTFIVWDRATGRPVGPAPTWQDTRAPGICEDLAPHAAEIARRTGLPLSSHYSAPKLAHMLATGAALRRRARAGDLLFGSVATWLLWNLTSGRTHATDPTHAARSLLFNIETMQWDPWLLELFDVPGAMLPRVVPSLGEIGTACIGGARSPGRQAPVRAMLGDQQAALFWAAGRRPREGTALVNYGTGAFVLIPSGGRPARRDGLLTSVAWTRGDRAQYLLEGTVNSAGAALDWLRRELGAPADLSGIARLCRAARGDALLLPGFWGMGSLHARAGGARLCSLWLDAEPTGTLADLTRAAVEATAHLVAEIFERAATVVPTIRSVIASGSLVKLEHLVRFQAALLGVPILVAGSSEATLIGIAAAVASASGSKIGFRGPAVSRVVKPSPRQREAAQAKHRRWSRLSAIADAWDWQEGGT